MSRPKRKDVIVELHRAGIPVVLIGAQAVRALGSSRESYDVDFAARNLDIDAIVDLMHELGYRLPVSAPAGGVVRWAQTAAAAKRFVENAKSGALNFFQLDANGEVLDQVDFVIDNPVPFARLFKDAETISRDPLLKRASPEHLIQMKSKRIAEGKGKDTDKVDLSFLRGLKKRRAT